MRGATVSRVADFRSFLLSLAIGLEDCQTVVDWLAGINVYALITGTVLQELADIEINDPDPFNKANASQALLNISTWVF
jgi:hypothetical protein